MSPVTSRPCSDQAKTLLLSQYRLICIKFKVLTRPIRINRPVLTRIDPFCIMTKKPDIALRATNLPQTERGNMSAAFLAFLICVFAGPLHETLMGAVISILHDKVDFARRQFATRRLLDSQPPLCRLLTGHGKGPWDDIGDRWKHVRIENVFPPSFPPSLI